MKKLLLFVTVLILISSTTVFLVLYRMGDEILNDVVVDNMAIVELENEAVEEAVVEVNVIPEPPEETNDVEIEQTDQHPEIAKEKEGEEAKSEKHSDLVDKAKVESNSNNGYEEKEEVEILAFTPGDIKAVESNVTAADKLKAAALVLKKLTVSDIKMLRSMLDGGVSIEEKEKAKQIVFARFNDEEVKKIKEIYSKYAD